MNIVIVEDEPVIARRLERMLRDIGGTTIRSVAHAASLEEARSTVTAAIDLLFLDLNLNGRNGFHLLEEIASADFQTIVVSAHHDEALRAFEYGVTDFVAKPFSEPRLRKALERAAERAQRSPAPAQSLTVRKGRELRSVDVDRIVFVRGADDYSELHLEDGTSHLHQKTLAALEESLPGNFVRIHRSYIVNSREARGLRGSYVVLRNGGELPLGRNYRDSVRVRLRIS